MTQKEKLQKAFMMAHRIKAIANRIEHDARDFDVLFPLEEARELRMIANEFLEL